MLVIYILPIAVEVISWCTSAASSQLVTLVTNVKYLNYDLIINIWNKAKKKTEMEKEREELDRMKDFKVESKDVKLC